MKLTRAIGEALDDAGCSPKQNLIGLTLDEPRQCQPLQVSKEAKEVDLQLLPNKPAGCRSHHSQSTG